MRTTRWAVAVSTMLVAALVAACSGAVSQPATSNPQGIVAEVASYQLVADQPGRLLIALISGDNRWLSFGTVTASFEYLGDGRGTAAPGVSADPQTAHFLAIPGSPEQADSPPVLTLPADGRGLYTVEPVTFPRAGYWQVIASGQPRDGPSFEASAAFTVLDRPMVTAVGAPALHTENPVIGTPGVALAAIDSRAAGGAAIPDPELHATSIAQALDQGHPALIVFSTPVYCVSRFCGPVTDLVADLASVYGDRADFIHIEIYRDFQAGLVNQAALDWLQTDAGELREPWTFFIDADGLIAGSWDTVVARSELEPILQALPVKGR